MYPGRPPFGGPDITSSAYLRTNSSYADFLQKQGRNEPPRYPSRQPPGMPAAGDYREPPRGGPSWRSPAAPPQQFFTPQHPPRPDSWQPPDQAWRGGPSWRSGPPPPPQRPHPGDSWIGNRDRMAPPRLQAPPAPHFAGPPRQELPPPRREYPPCDPPRENLPRREEPVKQEGLIHLSPASSLGDDSPRREPPPRRENDTRRPQESGRDREDPPPRREAAVMPPDFPEDMWKRPAPVSVFRRERSPELDTRDMRNGGRSPPHRSSSPRQEQRSPVASRNGHNLETEQRNRILPARAEDVSHDRSISPPRYSDPHMSWRNSGGPPPPQRARHEESWANQYKRMVEAQKAEAMIRNLERQKSGPSPTRSGPPVEPNPRREDSHPARDVSPRKYFFSEPAGPSRGPPDFQRERHESESDIGAYIGSDEFKSAMEEAKSYATQKILPEEPVSSKQAAKIDPNDYVEPIDFSEDDWNALGDMVMDHSRKRAHPEDDSPVAVKAPFSGPPAPVPAPVPPPQDSYSASQYGGGHFGRREMPPPAPRIAAAQAQPHVSFFRETLPSVRPMIAFEERRTDGERPDYARRGPPPPRPSEQWDRGDRRPPPPPMQYPPPHGRPNFDYGYRY